MVSPHEARQRADAVMELHEAGELEEAVEEVESLLAALQDGQDLDDPVLRESLFTARFERAVLLTELGDLDAAAEAYAVAATTPADLDDPDQRHEIALALLNRGICLDTVGDHETAVAVYADLVARFQDAEDPVTADQVVRARVNHAAALLALERTAEASASAAAISTELDPTDVVTAEQHVMALRLQAAALQAAGDVDGAIEVLLRRGEATLEDPSARAQVAAAAQEHAQLLAELGQVEDAIEVLDDALEDADLEIDPEVGDVLDGLRADRWRLAAR
jgi:tetratricopeptide (TPR) repeat protein